MHLAHAKEEITLMSKWRGCVVCLFLVTLPVAALADDARASHPRAYVGAGGGLGLVTLGVPSPDPGAEYPSKLGFTAGLFAGWRFSDVLGIQLESTVSAKGFESTQDGLPFGVFSRYYIEFPLLLKLVAPLSGRIAPHASLGPVPGILLQAETDLADGRHINLTDRTERIDLGIMLAAGASIDVGASGAIYLDARYNRGLLNTNKIATSEDSETTNRAFYVTIGYQTDLSIFSGDH
jgi:hypothetical protein